MLGTTGEADINFWATFSSVQPHMDTPAMYISSRCRLEDLPMEMADRDESREKEKEQETERGNPCCLHALMINEINFLPNFIRTISFFSCLQLY